jgi:hypothetical protein
VNNGFATLRQHIPSHVAQGYGDRGKKLSKVETLRMAVEYIRGLQRLLAEADGLEYPEPGRSHSDSSMMIPSPAGSVYSGSTHNGSGGDVLCLGGSELDEAGEVAGTEDPEPYLMDDEEEDNEKERREGKRFREDGPAQNRYERGFPSSPGALFFYQSRARARAPRGFPRAAPLSSFRNRYPGLCGARSGSSLKGFAWIICICN